jgi:hypothetical protein
MAITTIQTPILNKLFNDVVPPRPLWGVSRDPVPEARTCWAIVLSHVFFMPQVNPKSQGMGIEVPTNMVSLRDDLLTPNPVMSAKQEPM